MCTASTAAHLLLTGGARRFLTGRSELLDAGLRHGRDGHLIGPTVDVCTRMATELNTLLEPAPTTEVQ